MIKHTIFLGFTMLTLLFLSSVFFDGAEANSSRLTFDDFEYLGAFKVPIGTFGESTFAYGGNGLAWRPDGDPAGDADGYPGSLFAAGHEIDQLVAEISIPEPKPHNGGTADLNEAGIIQPFADLTGGLGAQAAGDYRIGGFTIAEVPGQGDKLHWSVFRWYNVAGDHFPGHGWSDLDLANPNPHGTWELGDYHNQQTAGYLFTAPADFADANLGGKRIVSGLNIQQGVATSSQGPAMFAFNPWQNGADVRLETTPMLYYPYEVGTIPDHKNPDQWEGGVWVEAGDKSAVLVVGRKSLGEERYGLPEEGDCSQHQGYHGDPYQPQILFYDPADLATVPQGQTNSWDVVPYKRAALDNDLIETCEWFLTGVAYDSGNQLLYILQPNADTVSNEFEPYPVVNVYKISADGNSQPPTEDKPWKAFLSFIGGLFR